MASTQLSRQLATTLQDVGNLLSAEDMKNLVDFTDDIDSDCVQEFAEAQRYFACLRDLGLLFENNVDFLIDMMEELHMEHALKPLQEYKLKYLKCKELPEIKSSDNVDYKYVQKECDNHKGQPLMYFCITCEVYICPNGLFRNHRDASQCEVIELQNLSHEIELRQKDLMTDLESLQENIVKEKNLWARQEENIGKHHTLIRKAVIADEKAMQKTTEEFTVTLTEKLREEEKAHSKQLMLLKEMMENVKRTTEHVRDRRYRLQGDILAQLRAVQESNQKLASAEKKLIKAQHSLKGILGHTWYRKKPNTGEFGKLRVCSLVGSVIVSSKDLVHVLDARKHEGGVILVSVDPEDNKKEQWSFMIPKESNSFPVILSYVSLRCNLKDDGKIPLPALTIMESLNMVYGGDNHLLLAIGREVFVVRPAWGTIPLELLHPLLSVRISNIDKNSWITSIAAFYKNYEVNERFLVSVNNSTVIRECKISGEVVRTIKTTKLVPSIKSIAYTDNYIAIASQLVDHVLLVNADNAAMVKGQLRLPSSSQTAMQPACVVWTGSKWVVLYVSEKPVSAWKIVSYDEAGEASHICDEGKLDGTSAPISVTRLQYTAFTTFTDSTVRKVNYEPK